MPHERVSQERPAGPGSGWMVLLVVLIVFAVGTYWLASGIRAHEFARVIGGIVALLVVTTAIAGFFVNAPNEATVITLAGDYRGTALRNGFWWTNPFATKKRISLRARTLNGEKLKVNDKIGNPIEIAAVVVWRVRETAHASFDVDDYTQYVNLQSETAVRHLASSYPYDAADDEKSLRGATDELNVHLQTEIQERVRPAGVEVIEARLKDLSYAPEIAGEMLRRQQASAVVSARTKIVEGAVGMVEHALEELSKSKLVTLDDERRAAMVSNLLVVLCSETGARPVINTGTLYH